MGNTRFGNSRRALALLSGTFVALAGLTTPALAADVTKSNNGVTWTIGDSIPAEFDDETRLLAGENLNVREQSTYYTLNAADGQPAAWAPRRGIDVEFNISEENSDWTMVLPGQLERLPSTATTAMLPYEAVQNGVISREDMEKALRAMSFFSFVGRADEYATEGPRLPVDPDTYFMMPFLPDLGYYVTHFVAFEDLGSDSEPDLAAQMAFAHLLNPSLDFTQNADGTYSSNFPGTPGAPIPAEATVVTKGASVWGGSDIEEETPNMATLYRIYKQLLDRFENHDTSDNMLDVNLDTENTQVSLSDDESQYTATFVLPTDEVWDANVWDDSRSVRSATVALTYELYKKSASGEELVASATPGQYTDENGVTTIKMTFPVDASTTDYVLKAKADHGLVSVVIPPNGDNESALYTPVAFSADLVSEQPISISAPRMKTEARPANNGVIEADSANITVTDEITPKIFANGTYKFVGEIREVTDGVAGEPIATATTTATLTDGTWDPAAPLTQEFTDVPVEAGKRYVIFERAYVEGNDTAVYASHENAADNDQSFLILKRVVPTIPTSTKSTTTTATKEATVTSTTTETTTNTVTSTSWVVEPSVETETSTVNETTTVVVPETETSTVTSTATAETTTVTTVPAGSDVATETVIVNETTVVTSTTDAPVTTVPAETTTNTVTDTATATTTVIVDNGDNDGSAALSSKLPWWLILIPVIPAVLGFIWNAVSHLQLPGLPAPAPAGSVGLIGAADNRNNPAPAPQPCERVSFRGHNLTWGVLAGTISLIFGQNVTDHCVND